MVEVQESIKLFRVLMQVPQGHPSFLKSAEQLQSRYTVSISTAQQDFKEIFAAQSFVKGYESVNGFHREPSSDECSIQRGSEVRETLKEEKVPLLETLPLVGYAEDDLRVGILCHSVSSPQDERCNDEADCAADNTPSCAESIELLAVKHTIDLPQDFLCPADRIGNGAHGCRKPAPHPDRPFVRRYRERDVFHSNGGSSEFATRLRYSRACADVLSLPSSISSTSSEGAIQLLVLTL
jgi:hypothetical protein